MQQIKIAANSQIAVIFKTWSSEWESEVEADKKDAANKFHTVYNIAAELFAKGGEIEISFISALFNDCKQKTEMAEQMINKIKASLKDDPERAEKYIAKVNTAAQDAAFSMNYLGQLLLKSA
ncbi:hypothetical protein C0W92_07285 [Photobacterium angustum]|uniref:Uncharacterized protein n=2 Tax=Photobacterium angustum TaxID=661 RepID=A0A0D8QZN0_PHOAN|nr:hypothetical protein [Photobacterium angustum]KJF82431.1 hypothetical protein UB36_06490 [Photobacterium damselae subsp. damselae]EAS64422.1 hypothetical protein VAS14_01851 [Photobacterium angustum S14]KJF94646.1 hypothetical protein UB39_09290 [Photobacterium angustum]KJG03320.1 hypothetical protein UB35_00475 [Photobacterium angustum]KJG07821.1 hypothetical protein UB33_02640 [Photobacterium angustum]